LLDYLCEVFFVQAEDGIRDRNVTGVQTCALPILEIVKDAYLYPRKNLQDYMGICLVGVGNDETSISATSYRLYGVTENNKLLVSVQQIGKGIINLEKSEATEIMIGGISQTFMDDFYWNLNNRNNPNLLQA